MSESPTPPALPSSAAPSQPKTRLPLPRPALTALDQSRKCATSSLPTHFRVLYPHFSEQDSLEYIMKRLQRGLTTPTARKNYALLLCALTRHTKYTKQLLQTPFPPHTTPREEALATLSVIAALVRAGVRDASMAPTLKQLATVENGRWRLGDACVVVLQALVTTADHSLLREWCRERRAFGDGLHLACVLLRNKVLSDKAFSKIYDAEMIQKALLEACDTGFSMIRDYRIRAPAVWEEALLSENGLLGISLWRALEKPSAGVEKKLLAVALLPVAARRITLENFDTVFTSYMGKITKSLCDMRESRGVRLRLDRVTESAKRAVKTVLDSMGQEVWVQLTKVTREIDEADDLGTRFLVWCVKHGVVHRLFPKFRVLEGAEERFCVKLFDTTVREFAKDTGARGALIKFLFTLAARRGFVREAVLIIALYTAFDGGECGIKFERFKSDEGEMFAGCLPMPSPLLSISDAKVSFRRLVDFTSEHKVATYCLDILRKGLNSGMRPRCKARIDADEKMKDTIFRIVNSIAKAPQGTDKELVASLRLVAEFVTIQYFAPCEDDETGRKPVAEFRDLVYSLDECVSTVCGESRAKGEDEPMPIEKVAHMITGLCGHESASFRQIAIKAVEALGSRLDDVVTAVFFDAMDAYVSGSGVTDGEGDDEDDEKDGEEEGKDDDEDGNEENEGEEEDEDNENNNEDEEMRERMTNGKDEQQDSESEDDSGLEMNGGANDEKGNQNAESEEDDETGPDVDMDPDDEDPEVLAQFDKRLAMHMKLINKEKKTAKRRKLRAQFRFTQVSRVLSLVESVAKILRMRLETLKDVDQRAHIVFLDLHARLYEFALGDEADNGRFLTHVTGVATKQMMLPPSFFVGKISDSETVVEVAKRFLQSIRGSTTERRPSDEETRAVSKSAGCLIGAAAALTGANYAQFVPLYEELVRQALQSTEHFVKPGMLASFFRKAPVEAAKLFSVVEELVKEDGISRNLRTTASEIVLDIAEAAREGSEPGDEKLQKFWDGLSAFLKVSVNSENVKSWRPLAIANFVQAASHGIRGGRFTDDEGVSAVLSETVQKASHNRSERLKLLKLLRTPGDGKTTKRERHEDNNDGDAGGENDLKEEVDTETTKMTRPRKRAKRSKAGIVY